MELGIVYNLLSDLVQNQKNDIDTLVSKHINWVQRTAHAIHKRRKAVEELEPKEIVETVSEKLESPPMEVTETPQEETPQTEKENVEPVEKVSTKKEGKSASSKKKKVIAGKKKKTTKAGDKKNRILQRLGGNSNEEVEIIPQRTTRSRRNAAINAQAKISGTTSKPKTRRKKPPVVKEIVEDEQHEEPEENVATISTSVELKSAHTSKPKTRRNKPPVVNEVVEEEQPEKSEESVATISTPPRPVERTSPHVSPQEHIGISGSTLKTRRNTSSVVNEAVENEQPEETVAVISTPLRSVEPIPSHVSPKEFIGLTDTSSNMKTKVVEEESKETVAAISTPPRAVEPTPPVVNEVVEEERTEKSDENVATISTPPRPVEPTPPHVSPSEYIADSSTSIADANLHLSSKPLSSFSEESFKTPKVTKPSTYLAFKKESFSQKAFNDTQEKVQQKMEIPIKLSKPESNPGKPSSSESFSDSAKHVQPQSIPKQTGASETSANSNSTLSTVAVESHRRFRPFSKKSRIRQRNKNVISEKSLLDVARKPPVLSSQGQAALNTARKSHKSVPSAVSSVHSLQTPPASSVREAPKLYSNSKHDEYLSLFSPIKKIGKSDQQESQLDSDSEFLAKLSKEMGLSASSSSSSILGAFLDSHTESSATPTKKTYNESSKEIVTDFKKWMSSNKIDTEPAKESVATESVKTTLPSSQDTFSSPAISMSEKSSSFEPEYSSSDDIISKMLRKSTPAVDNVSVDAVVSEKKSSDLTLYVKTSPQLPTYSSDPQDTPAFGPIVSSVPEPGVKESISIWKQKKQHLQSKKEIIQSRSTSSDKSAATFKVPEPKLSQPIPTPITSQFSLDASSSIATSDTQEPPSNMSRKAFTMIPTKKPVKEEKPKNAGYIKSLEIAKKKREEDEKRRQLRERERQDAKRQIEMRKQARMLKSNPKATQAASLKSSKKVGGSESILKPISQSSQNTKESVPANKAHIMKKMASQKFMQSMRSSYKRKTAEAVTSALVIPDEPFDSEDDLSDHYEEHQVPAWAKPNELTNALRVQDVDHASSIFQSVPASCDLTEIFQDFPVKKRYKRRTSSAQWGRAPYSHGFK